MKLGKGTANESHLRTTSLQWLKQGGALRVHSIKDGVNR